MQELNILPADETKTEEKPSVEELIEKSSKSNYPERYSQDKEKQAEIKDKEEDSATSKTKEEPSQDVKSEKTDEDASEHIDGRIKRINKLTARNKQYEKIITDMKNTFGKEITEMKRIIGELTKKPKPSPDNYDDGVFDTQYIEDLTDWKIENRESSSKKEITEPAIESKEKEVLGEQDEDEDEENAIIEDFRHDITEKYGEEIAKKVFDKYMTNEVMRELIMEDDNGVKLGLYFADNHKEARRISELSPMKTLNECQTIISKLNSKSKTKTEASQIIGENIKGEKLEPEQKSKTTEELLRERDEKNYPEKYGHIKM